ncbi:T9SS type A sorting domain-containing protein [Ferruginibacter lapsinanis]|uniref:T9SS type A sorting domain-containing protein n=1 Tax=Ferruginibacter lapsinanis TaxID=563172 RepID=UPI001E56AE21|nr:T9SS type A sorting domain-containing protein [Ferruginibacter lapsinanis]UEG48686.1 T9SS type A sorting domain-containing protein [Ferruginibacter lapsinanis]
MKTFLPSVILLTTLVFFSSHAKAQNTDLPNPNKNIKVLPAGSFVIAMDKTYQANPGYFNIKTYGLLVNLMNGGIRLRWVIDSGKVHGAADFSVLAEKITPSFVAAGTTPKDFKAGPFVITPSDTALARLFITIYNNSMTPVNKINVYRTTAPVNVNVRYDLTAVKPKAAVLNDGGKGSIQIAYMTAASIPSTNYKILDSAVNLYNGCYTFASEPHNDGGGSFPIARIVDSLRDFVQKGGNFLAECAAIETYENVSHSQSSLGIDVLNNAIKTNINYANPDLSYAQFDGIFTPEQGGSCQSWTRKSGSVALNNFYPVINGSTAATDSVFGATVSKHRSGKGGLIFYLGNHSFSGNTDDDINGIRLYMNAFLTPAAYGNCPLYQCDGNGQCGPLPVTLKSFKAKKLNLQQVQLNWSTSTELNAKEFIIERSFDGISFVGIGRVNAQGYSSTEVAYAFQDQSPKNGYNYYRLTEISNDSKVSYSEIVSVYFSGKNLGLEVYPAPARESITVDMNSFSATNNLISIFDLTGKAMINKLKVNSNSVKIDVRAFPAGTYILKAVDANGTMLQSKFSVIKH